MSIDGNGDKGAISCVKPKIIPSQSSEALYASLRTIMDFSYSYEEI